MSGRLCNFGEPGGWLWMAAVMTGESGGDGVANNGWELGGCPDGDGDREIMPEAILGLPSDRRTVSSVRSILRSERVRISCFLGLLGQCS